MTVTTLGERTVLVFDPTAEGLIRQDTLAARAASLNGKLIGLLDNTKDLVEVLLTEARTLLQKDFPKAEFRYFRKESVSGVKPDLLQQVATCDVVITAVGD